MDLHPLERKVIEGLQKLGGKGSSDEVAHAGGIEKIQAERFGYSLSQKGLVKLHKKVREVIKLTELGKKYLKEGLPEIKILKTLEKGKLNSAELAEKSGLSEKEIFACIGILRQSTAALIIKGDYGLEFELTKVGEVELLKGDILKDISEGEEIDEETIKALRKRGIITSESTTVYELELEKDAGRELAKGRDVSHQLTHEMLMTGAWKKTKFRAYDVHAPVNPFYGGKLHPLTIAINKIRRIFLELGFQEAKGPVVESSFWNFDALFQPQDHPARDLADTFYLKNPKKSKLPDEKIVTNVKNTHEKGTVGSKGWQYKWNKELSTKPILRTHTTAVTARYLAGAEPPAKIFCIGRTFRNETVDFKHLPEFTQIDGIVVDENVTFKDLLGYLKEFYWRLGFEKIRFRPAYFPYTEMSVEPEVYLEEREEWIELGGSGIFRPEVTEPLGIDVPVLAWGLSLERPIMLRLGLNDIRNFYYKNDLKLLREVPVI